LLLDFIWVDVFHQVTTEAYSRLCRSSESICHRYLSSKL